MSGGPDFEPRGVRDAKPERVAVAAKPATPVVEPTPIVKPEPVEKLVIRTSAASEKVVPTPVESDAQLGEEETKALLSQVAAGLKANPSLFSDENVTLTLASLEQGLGSLEQVATDAELPTVDLAAPVEPPKDIREISGTRVNMRDGPGTIYPIIGKARIGQQVEVLSESGTGWLRLRVLPGQQVGWISASLVRKTTN
ncbi:SH3 domain-containing protein [Ruegeria sp. HKCCD5849]|nr:SH3 domain-containing protein [Ruegeria sp. HKCCD7296]NOD49561.1 SH3 domain-containing protein [Ruegeria sp. HKCCD5849]NOD53874.1 SH3 domain-containing protein [Ruegeria sp. HKCCD5851]NOD69889.1 SH3 domain-containing protein [Ruegeria sp. HKCCD7303]NOE35518.1 SH3 domain-containing protein [Ruegeria sp. HKCCD7318]NOE42534.1 SH3 domain-containing protein [Ruegeria sp. HKCCD7319]